MSREWALLKALQSAPDGLGYRELARSMGMAQRTVYRDIHTLKAAGFPLERARFHGRAVWRFRPGPVAGPGAASAAGGGVPAVAFTRQELIALAMARGMLTSVPGSPFNRAMEQAFRKIRAASGPEGSKAVEIADRRLFADLRRGRPYTRRETWFQSILDAVEHQKTMNLHYLTMERGEETAREIDPYGLVFHEGAFYVVAYCHLRKAVRTFLIDRVRMATATGRHFTPPAGFSVRAHFREAWGLIRDRALETVRVRFSPAAARIVREGRWHESQRIVDEPGGSVVLEVRVAGWEELKRWVMGFGPSAEALEPAALRESICADVAAMAASYAKGAASEKGGRGRNSGAG